MSGGVFISSEVDPRRIAPDVILRPGVRIVGRDTSIGPGCVLGEEGPVTVENCQLGRRVELKGGFFSGAVFFDDSSVGASAHIRPGTILEEQANGAHAVGLKQTLLFPYVTLGSLINFCDVLMAGGTSRKDHSEVGSSYVHFNFTPNQDKATASLIGDVPRGVLLRERPVFLGGQGGLVGPARIAYGSVIAAGGVCRKDLIEENRLHIPAAPPERTIPFVPGRYGNIDRIVKNCLIYIGNIRALKAWYEQVRMHFIRDAADQAVFNGALANLDLILKERFARLKPLEKAAPDLKRFSWERFIAQNPERAPSVLMDEIKQAGKEDYLAAVKGLSDDARTATSLWLQQIVDQSMLPPRVQ